MLFKLCAILSSVRKPCTAPVHPTWDVSDPFVHRLHAVPRRSRQVIRPPVSAPQCLCPCDPCTTYQWPHITEAVMLAIRMRQREARKCSL